MSEMGQRPNIRVKVAPNSLITRILQEFWDSCAREARWERDLSIYLSIFYVIFQVVSLRKEKTDEISCLTVVWMIGVHQHPLQEN